MDSKTEATFYSHPSPGYLVISDADQRDFLQRQTTNDINLLSPSHILATVLTSPTARILDVFYLFIENGTEDCENPHKGNIGILPTPSSGDRIYQYLKSRIFFMDKVSLTNLSHEFCQVDLFGAETSQVLKRIGLPTPPGEYEIVPATHKQTCYRILQHAPYVGMGFRLIVPSQSYQELLSDIAEAGAESLTQESYHLLRIEKGIPALTNELSEDYTPLEINLRGAIADKKGCYTGQEVIARQITYDKVTRRMVGIYLDKLVSSGTKLSSSQTQAGVITSVVESPRFGPIGLAVVKRPFDQPGIELTAYLDSEAIHARVTNLPFSQK